ncbi:MAG: hypothetical protein PWQ17_1691 [Anaerophaga sp.]|nr:hypothetical protein [Anaerophaga sp.]
MNLNDAPTYIELKFLFEKYPENTLLQFRLKYYRPYPQTDISDDDILYEALKENITFK